MEMTTYESPTLPDALYIATVTGTDTQVIVIFLPYICIFNTDNYTWDFVFAFNCSDCNEYGTFRHSI
jgi:hypothetical protein